MTLALETSLYYLLNLTNLKAKDVPGTHFFTSKGASKYLTVYKQKQVISYTSKRIGSPHIINSFLKTIFNSYFYRYVIGANFSLAGKRFQYYLYHVIAKFFSKIIVTCAFHNYPNSAFNLTLK